MTTVDEGVVNGGPVQIPDEVTAEVEEEPFVEEIRAPSVDENLTVRRPRRVCAKPKWMSSGDYVMDG